MIKSRGNQPIVKSLKKGLLKLYYKIVFIIIDVEIKRESYLYITFQFFVNAIQTLIGYFKFHNSDWVMNLQKDQ